MKTNELQVHRIWPEKGYDYSIKMNDLSDSPEDKVNELLNKTINSVVESKFKELKLSDFNKVKVFFK